MMNHRAVTALVLLAGFAAPEARCAAPFDVFSGQTGSTSAKEMVCPETKAEPAIDALLSEPCWQKAAKVSGFYRIQKNDRAEERTVFMVTHDRRALYVAFAVADRDIAAKARRRDQSTWEDDCVELFLDPQRARQDRFHFIVSAAGSLYDASLGKDQWNAKPDVVRAAKQIAGQGWTVEMKIPLATLGIKDAPRQGEVWDLKLAREDYGVENRVPALSSWQFVAKSFSDAGAFGRLVFIDRNCCYNGDFGKGHVPPKPGETWSATRWRVVPSYRERAGADLVLDENQGHDAAPCGKALVRKNNLQVQVLVLGRPNRDYHVTAWVNLDQMAHGSKVEMYTERANRVGARRGRDPEGWQQLETHVSTKTGSSVALVFTTHSGSGSWLIDDVSVVEVENVPRDLKSVCLTGNAVGTQAVHNRRVDGRYTYYELGSKAYFFPQEYERGAGDVVAHAGWVPFSQGKLTDGKPSYVQYHHWTKTPGKTVVMDLGKDHFITDVEIEPVFRKLKWVDVWLKPGGATHYTLAARPDPKTGTIRSGALNAHARYVRIDNDGEGGLREVRVWSRPAAGFTPPKPYAVPMKTDRGAGGPALAEKTFAIFPTPKEMTKAPDVFSLRAGVKIVVAADASDDTRATASDLAEQLTNRCGVSADVTSQAGGRTVQLTIRQVPQGKKEKGEEGYELSVHGDGVRVVGGGEDGLFYGCQSLLQCVVNTPDGPAFQCVHVRDWPTYSFRSMQTWTRQLRTREVLEAAKVLARMKMNQILIMGTDRDGPTFAHQLARLHMDAVPVCCAMPAGSWFRDFIERKPGEKVTDLPARSRINPCPSDPRCGPAIEAAVRRAAAYPGKWAYINCDEMYQEHKGARWNACPLCRARKLSGGDLFHDLLMRIYDRMADIGKKPVMLDTMYCVPYKDMEQAFAKLPRDIPIIVWHPKVQKGLAKLGYQIGEWFDGDRWTIDHRAANVIGGVVPADGGFKLEKCAIIAEALWSGTYPDLTDPAMLHQLSDVMSQVHEATIAARLPSRGALVDQFEPIDLSDAANASLSDREAGDGIGLFDLGPGADLAFMRGEHKLGGVPFHIGGTGGKDIVVMENRGALDPRFPPEVTVPVARKAASLLFLHALTKPLAWSYAAQLTYVGTYVIRYDDGSCVAFPIEYKRNILEYDALSPERRGGYKSSLVTLPAAIPAYQGTMPSGRPILLLSAEWVNPFPAKMIASVSVRSTSRMFGTRVALFGVTAVKPTARDEQFWSGRSPARIECPVAEEAPAGLKEIDLAGGVQKSDAEYTAPGGTTITGSSNYLLRGATFIGFMNTGQVTRDNDFGWQVIESKPQTLAVAFPRTRPLAGVSILGLPQTPEYIFGGPSPIDYSVSLSADGATWAEVASRKRYLPDLHWESDHFFDTRPVKALRVTIVPSSRRGARVRGLARLRLYAPKEDQP